MTGDTVYALGGHDTVSKNFFNTVLCGDASNTLRRVALARRINAIFKGSNFHKISAIMVDSFNSKCFHNAST